MIQVLVWPGRAKTRAILTAFAALVLAAGIGGRGRGVDLLHAAAPKAGDAFEALQKQASDLYNKGAKSGDNASLVKAIDLYRRSLDLAPRTKKPADWAMTQNNLGNALSALGERESGPARLEEAVKAYRAALEELTRERAPLDWARTQMKLGSALATLGERESGTARLEEAVKAYRAALEERPAPESHSIGLGRR